MIVLKGACVTLGVVGALIYTFVVSNSAENKDLLGIKDFGQSRESNRVNFTTLFSGNEYFGVVHVTSFDDTSISTIVISK
jgi:hypothetical protein